APEGGRPSEVSGGAARARPSAAPAEGGVGHWAMQRDGRTRSESSVDLQIFPDKSRRSCPIAPTDKSERPPPRSLAARGGAPSSIWSAAELAPRRRPPRWGAPTYRPGR